MKSINYSKDTALQNQSWRHQLFFLRSKCVPDSKCIVLSSTVSWDLLILEKPWNGKIPKFYESEDWQLPFDKCFVFNSVMECLQFTYCSHMLLPMWYNDKKHFKSSCDSATETSYSWRKICPESSHKRWLDVADLAILCEWQTKGKINAMNL